ncbi:MAG TPA: hypothetical protein VFI65_33150 [Streptosporangiaceae bacterium]|nr:hypothetical protein [Streptosporangiaceae bacterium]
MLMTTLVTGCGKSIPKTQANLTLCKVLAKVLDKQAPIMELTAATFLNNNPITRRLREEVGTYVANISGAPNLAMDGARKAESDCASIGAPVAAGY